MKHLVFAFLPIIFICSLSAQQKNLTPDQKAKDFQYLVQILQENYPYFGVAKRQFNVDWLAKKQMFTDALKNTPNDSSYVLKLFSIIRQLKNGHTSLFVNTRAKKYKALYEDVEKTHPGYHKWVKALADPKARPAYWSGFIMAGDSGYLAYIKHKNDPVAKSDANVTDTLLQDGKTAVLTIHSFDGLRIKEDGEKIGAFFHRLKGVERLIIDITDNGGGSTTYWKKNIVEPLLDTPVIYTGYPFAKAGPVNKYFHPEFFDGATVLQKGYLPNIPEELLDGTYMVNKYSDTLTPAPGSIHFKGKIYLLVNKKVFSSSEGFAQFCATTKWAKIAGQKTGGDGIGSDPAIICLPQSGILLTFPTESGLNYDGAINFEQKTTPDIDISADNETERLQKLIKYINLNT